MSQRFTIQASALGNYFGVGFISPMEQLEIDLGERERVIYDNVQDRMDFGVMMEGPLLNYWEKKLDISIVNRNETVFEVLDGSLRCKIDGETMYDGALTVVECKNTTGTSSFVNEKGYLLQVHAYMMSGVYQQALLLGAHNGRPDFRLIKKEDWIISDIEEMVTTVTAILNGMLSKEDFPWHLVEKWSGSSKLPDLTDSVDINDVYEYIKLTEQIKELEEKRDAIAEEMKAKYDAGEVMTPIGKFTISKGSRKGGIDEQALRVAFPNIDFEKYRKPDSSFKTIRVSRAKVKA